MIRTFSLFILFLIYSCQEKNRGSKEVTVDTNGNKQIPICNNCDSALSKFSNNFVPKDLELSNSISPELDSFLRHADTNCLRKQNLYKPFLATIFAKLAVYHLKCCHQGYDLFQMKGTSANILVHEFENVSDYHRNKLEMLNSGVVFDFIQEDSSLESNKMLKELHKGYLKEEKREIIFSN